MNNRYVIDFYDMIDGWCHSWEIRKEYQFESKEQAIEKAKELMSSLDQQNRDAGEHYGVIDLNRNLEIWCGKEMKF